MKTITAMFLVCMAIFLSGCFAADTVEFFTPEGPPNDQEIYEVYGQINVGQTDAAKALEILDRPEYELLSQSKTVLVSAGVKKDAYKRWFNMVGFDENDLVATRKYMLLVDETPKILFKEPWPGLRFRVEMTLPSKVLEEPYANENERRIAVVRYIHEKFREDMQTVRADSEILESSGMMINQAFETVAVELKHSPAFAKYLGRPEGLEFDHINLDKAKMRLFVGCSVIRLEMKAGVFAKQKECDGF